MTAFWCEQAVIEGVATPHVRIREDDGLIAAVELGVEPATDDVVLWGLTLPGLANGHSHAFHRALRGRTHADGGSFWTWREQMYRVAVRLDPQNYLELATAVFAEMLLAGYTAVGEFHYVHHRPDGSPYDPPTAMEDAIVEAARRAGIRLTLLDTLYLDGGIGEPLAAEQLRFSDGTVGAWAERRDSVRFGDLARGGAAMHSVRAVSPEHYADVRDATRGLPLHAHVSEQPAENEAALAAYGSTPTRLLASAELLGPSFTAVHATHLTDDDVKLLGDTGTLVCFCPTTERDLADGIGRARELADVTSLALGSDQNAVVDPFEELRGLELNERLASGRRGRIAPGELLLAGTRNGYTSLGWVGGMIAVDAVCDLVTIDLGSVRTAGARPDQAWYAATGSDVIDVIVGGEFRVRDRTHPLGDVGELLSDAIRKVTE